MAKNDQEQLDGIELLFQKTYGPRAYRRFLRARNTMIRRLTWVSPWEHVRIRANLWSAVRPWTWTARFAGRVLAFLLVAVAVLALLLVVVAYALPRPQSGGPGPVNGSSVTGSKGFTYNGQTLTTAP